MLELVIVVHFSFIVWVVTGGFLAVRWWWLSLLHLPAFFWGLLLEWNGWICPLTPLENELRASRDLPTYDMGFIERYLVPVIYPEGLTRETQMILAGGLLAVNIVAYSYFVNRHILRKRKR